MNLIGIYVNGTLLPSLANEFIYMILTWSAISCVYDMICERWRDPCVCLFLASELKAGSSKVNGTFDSFVCRQEHMYLSWWCTCIWCLNLVSSAIIFVIIMGLSYMLVSCVGKMNIICLLRTTSDWFCRLECVFEHGQVDGYPFLKAHPLRLTSLIKLINSCEEHVFFVSNIVQKNVF